MKALLLYLVTTLAGCGLFPWTPAEPSEPVWDCITVDAVMVEVLEAAGSPVAHVTPSAEVCGIGGCYLMESMYTASAIAELIAMLEAL